MTRYRIGDPGYGLADVGNDSGSPGVDLRTYQSGPAPAPAPGHRTPVEVDAQSSRLRDSHMAQLLVHAAHRADQQHFARQRDTSPGAYMAHLFGVRNRAD